MKEVEALQKRRMVEIILSAFRRVPGGRPSPRRFLSHKAEATLKVMPIGRFRSF